MKKLRIVSVIIVLLLFCPFIRQCDGMNKKAEGTETADSTAVVINDTTYNEFIEKNEGKPIHEPKEEVSSELKTYFTEEAENVFDLALEMDVFWKNNFDRKFELKENIPLSSSILFSTLLIFTSIFGAIRIFKNKLVRTNWLYVLNILFALLIIIANIFIFLDRFGQIKIGFYLVLISNFYMLYLLKKQKEQIQS